MRQSFVRYFIVVMMVCLSWAAGQQVVTKTADTDDGTCDADCSLREAIANAADGDTITFNVSGTINLNSELVVPQNNLTIDASGQNVTVSGQNSHRIFNHTVTGGTFEINNLVVTRGNADFGGGIHSNGNVTVTNSTILSNRSTDNGGGIFSNGTVTVTNSTILGNRSNVRDGGGIYSRRFGSTVTVTNSTISGNSAVRGGGIFSYGTVTVTNSTISGNETDVSGGGIFSTFFGVTVTNSTISGNSAGLGGGILGNNDITITNSTISGNKASRGGGIFSYGTGTVITNSTISSNQGRGGGIFSDGTIVLNNSLVLGNETPIHGSITLNNSAYGFATGQSTGDSFVGLTLADVFTAPESMLRAPTTAGDYTLAACSPAINAGNNASVPNPTGNDLAGNDRIRVVTVDMGAFESNLQACQTIDFDLSGLPAKTYGDAAFDISGFATASSGLAVTFTSATPAVCTVAGATVSIVTAGTCTINADQAGNAAYQAAAQVQQDITIAKKALDATVDNQARDYGVANPAFTLTYTGFVPGDTAADIDVDPTLATTAVPTSDAGTYPITCTLASFDDDNYTLNTCTAGTLTVNQVAVTVTADNITITEGDTPTFTATYTGFVAPDDESVLDTPVSFTDNAPDYNTAGTYDITPSGAADVNYTFTYNTGTLTIQSAGFTITESGGNTAVTEGAGADTIEVVLTSIPTADVVITVTPDAQLDIGTGAGTADTLTFTPANWDTAQTINVTANDDADVEGAHSGTLGFTVASTDTNYDAAVLADITVAITDDEPAVIVTPTTLTTAEGAAATSYDMSLNTNPASAITVTVTPDAQTDVGAGAGTAIDLNFNDTTPQTVNVTAVDDTDIEGAHSSTISHAITTGDGGDYATTVVIDDVTVDITDNDAANTGGGSVINPNQDMQIRNGDSTDADTITSNAIEPLRYGTFKRNQTIILDFLVRNPGREILEIGELVLPSFLRVVGEPLPETLESFESALLSLAVNTSTAGQFSGQVSLASNDPDAFENPFVFDVIVTVSNEPAHALYVLPGIALEDVQVTTGQTDVPLLSFYVSVPAGSVPVTVDRFRLEASSTAIQRADNLRLYIDGGTRGELDNRDVFLSSTDDTQALTFTFPARTFSPNVPMWFIVVGDF